MGTSGSDKRPTSTKKTSEADVHAKFQESRTFSTTKVDHWNTAASSQPFEEKFPQSDDDMRQSQHGGPCDDAIPERIDSISLRCWRPDSSRRQRRRAWWCHYHEK